MQNDAKMHHKSARNDHEKTQIPMLQWSKTHAVDRAANLHENAFTFVVTVLRCSKHEFSKSSKVIENLSQMPAARRANSECITPKLNFRGRKILRSKSREIAPKSMPLGGAIPCKTGTAEIVKWL